MTRAELMRRATEARARAETATKPELRWLILDIARQFEELAEQIDQLEGLRRPDAFRADEI